MSGGRSSLKEGDTTPHRRTSMADTPAMAQGMWCHIEIPSADPATAKRFYSGDNAVEDIDGLRPGILRRNRA